MSSRRYPERDGPSLLRRALFEIPLWVTQIEEVNPYRAEMVDEVEALIDRVGPSSDHLAHQTQSDPFRLPSKGWGVLEERCNAVYRELARDNFQRSRSGQFHLRRWALRLGRLSTDEKRLLARDGLHNHLPALLSSVYYLRVPSELAGREEGGTLFVNPIGNVIDLMGPRKVIVPANEGTLIVFPSFLDHAPVPVAWDAADTSRVIVSTDVFYVSGQAERAATEQDESRTLDVAGDAGAR